MNIEIQFEPLDLVWYMKDNKAASAQVDDVRITVKLSALYGTITEVKYSLCNRGDRLFQPEELFSSKELLISSL